MVRESLQLRGCRDCRDGSGMLVAGSIPGGEFMTHGRGVRPTLSDRAGRAGGDSASQPARGFIMKIQIARCRTGVRRCSRVFAERSYWSFLSRTIRRLRAIAISPAYAPAKPSAAVPAVPRPLVTPQSSSTAPVVYGAYVPYQGPAVASATPGPKMVEGDGQIVLTVPEVQGQVREGDAAAGSFARRTFDSGYGAGLALLGDAGDAGDEGWSGGAGPAGSVMQGMVTEVHSGKRISGAAALHLERAM